MSDLPEKRPAQEMAVSATGAALAALLGCVMLPAGPDVAAAGAMLTPYTTRLVELAAAEWRRKSELVAETAVAASGLGDEEFCARLSGNPELLALAQKILWAASMSGNEHKLRTLGQLLGGAVKDRGDRLNEAQVLAAALADLEAPHVVVLDVLTGPAPHHAAMLARSDEVPDPGWWLPAQVQANTPMDPEFVLACLSTLTRHGLATTATGLSGIPTFGLTELGRVLAEVMRQASGPRPHED
jgi:hypothetical protein